MGKEQDEAIDWLESMAASMEDAEPEAHGEPHDRLETT